MAVSNGRVGPWSTIDVGIEGEPLAKKGLRKRRAALEAIVEPLVTSKKTADQILFQGKRRYLPKPLFSMGTEQFHAILALQFLYNIEAAWKAGDIDKAIRAAVGFAHESRDLELIRYVGVDSVGGAISRASNKQVRRETRLGKTVLRDVSNIVLELAYHAHRGKRDWLRCVTDEVISHRGGKIVSTKTVRKELRKRSIME